VAHCDPPGRPWQQKKVLLDVILFCPFSEVQEAQQRAAAAAGLRRGLGSRRASDCGRVTLVMADWDSTQGRAQTYIPEDVVENTGRFNN
jgi:hypothetical protein